MEVSQALARNEHHGPLKYPRHQHTSGFACCQLVGTVTDDQVYRACRLNKGNKPLCVVSAIAGEKDKIVKFCLADAGAERKSQPLPSCVMNYANLGVFSSKLIRDLTRLVNTAIVNDDNLEGIARRAQYRQQCTDHIAQPCFFAGHPRCG